LLVGLAGPHLMTIWPCAPAGRLAEGPDIVGAKVGPGCGFQEHCARVVILLTTRSTDELVIALGMT